MVCIEYVQGLRVFYETFFIVLRFSVASPRPKEKSIVLLIILGCLCSFQLAVEWKPQPRRTLPLREGKQINKYTLVGTIHGFSDK